MYKFQNTLQYSRGAFRTPIASMLGFFVKLVSRWKLIANETKSSILDVGIILDTSLCFFRKASNATCFIIHFNICSQIRTLWKWCHVQRKRGNKITKFVYFGAGNSYHWDRSMKNDYENFPFSNDINLKQNYIVIFVLLSLVSICQNYIGLY